MPTSVPPPKVPDGLQHHLKQLYEKAKRAGLDPRKVLNTPPQQLDLFEEYPEHAMHRIDANIAAIQATPNGVFKAGSYAPNPPPYRAAPFELEPPELSDISDLPNRVQDAQDSITATLRELRELPGLTNLAFHVESTGAWRVSCAFGYPGPGTPIDLSSFKVEMTGRYLATVLRDLLFLAVMYTQGRGQPAQQQANPPPGAAQGQSTTATFATRVPSGQGCVR